MKTNKFDSVYHKVQSFFSRSSRYGRLYSKPIWREKTSEPNGDSFWWFQITIWIIVAYNNNFTWLVCNHGVNQSVGNSFSKSEQPYSDKHGFLAIALFELKRIIGDILKHDYSVYSSGPFYRNVLVWWKLV